MNSQFPCFTYVIRNATVHIFLHHIVRMIDSGCKVVMTDGIYLELSLDTYQRLKKIMMSDRY